MGHIPIAQPSPPRRFKVPRAGIALVLLVVVFGAVLAVIVLFAWPGGEAPPPPVVASQADDFSPGSVTTFPEREFHLVRLPDGEFLALHMRDPHDKLLVEEGLAESPCLVSWRPEFEFMGETGWFRNPCHGETYDLTGRCVSGPCPRGLDRFPVTVKDGVVEVNVSELILGPTRPGAQGTPTPATPPQTTTGR